MKDRVERDRVSAENDLLLAAVHLRDSRRLAGEEFRREIPERRDQGGLDQLDLSPEMRLTRLDLLRQRVTVSRRPALQYVADPHVVARHPDPFEQLDEELPGGADERNAVLVLVEARRLAHEHQLGARGAGAEHDLRAGLGQRAHFAAGNHVAEGDQREVSRSCHNRRRNSHRHRYRHRRRAVQWRRGLRTTC